MARALLVVTNSDWMALARIPRSLAQGGFTVAAHTPADHIVTYSRHVQEAFTYTPPIDLPTFHATLAISVDRFKPDVLLPGDDAALWLLDRLVLDANLASHQPQLAAVLARSSAAPARVIELERKSSVVDFARAHGVPVPLQAIDPNEDEALGFASRCGYPVAVKFDYSWGGLGTRICASADALLDALRGSPDCPVPPWPARSLAVQQFLSGASYVAGYAAWEGQLLAYLPLQKVAVSDGGGSSAVRLVDDTAMRATVEAVVAHFGCSGIGDLDFRADADGRLHFLEINPRVVPTVTVGPLFGVDLCGVLQDALDGKIGPLQLPRPEANVVVAMFPYEWARDPSSPLLWTAHHDVPWDDPRLLSEMVRRVAHALPASPRARVTTFGNL